MNGYLVPCDSLVMEELFKKHVKDAYHFVDNRLVYSRSVELYDKDFRKNFAKKLKLSSKLLVRLAIKHCEQRRQVEKGQVQNDTLAELKERYAKSLEEY